MSEPVSMSRTSLVALTALIAAFSAPAIAQDDTEGADLLIVVDGTYRVKEELGLFGIVVDRRENVATFKPCHAPKIEIEANRLEPTDHTCSDSAPPNTNPMKVSCAAYDGFWSTQNAIDHVEMPGRVLRDVYTFETETGSVKVVQMEAQQVFARLDNVALFMTCGELLTGFDGDGRPVLNVYTGSTSRDGPDMEHPQ